MKYLLLAFALILSTLAHADEAARQSIITGIMEAQGLQQRLDQTKNDATTIGEHFYRRALLKNCLAHSANCNTEGQANPALDQVYTQYIERCAALFSANGYVDLFSGYSDAELGEIQAYYRSLSRRSEGDPLPKNVLSLLLGLNNESHTRMNREIRRMLKELDAIVCPNVLDTSDPSQCVLSTQAAG